MNIQDAARGGAIGLVVGTFATGLILRKAHKDYIKLDEKQWTRQHNKVDYLIKTMGPYVPSEKLAKIFDYMKTDLMASNEEGLDLK